MSPNIPKEYILEEFAMYDEHKIKMHVKGALALKSIYKIYKDGSPFLTSCFDKKEEKQIALDIFRWAVDTEEDGDPDVVVRKFFNGLHEAGYFG